MASTPNAVFDVINDRVIRMLDEGIVPWRKPWQGGAAGRPRNLDGRPYSGINAFTLALAGYSDPRWLTFKKALDLGGSVRKGEKGMPVVFWKQLVIESENDNGETTKKRVPMLRYFTVFNVEQCDGLSLKPLPVVAETGADPIEAAEAIIEAMPNAPTINHNGGDRAFYTPARDVVSLPDRRTFKSDEGYYETAFHELGHSTGHQSRLNREGIEGFDHFGSDKYAREELVAEFAAAFLMAESGIENPDTVENIAAYIASWKSRIAEDPKVLVVAAGRGEKAANYILGKAEQFEQEKAA